MTTDPSDEQRDFYQKRYFRLLAALQEKTGRWMTRYEIAAALGVRVFNSNLILGMEALESVELIEIRRVGRLWQYRTKAIN